MLTQEELKSKVSYNPDTGIFTWIVNNKNHMKVHSKAGWYNQGYIKLTINQKSYQAHRLVWLYVYGFIPELDIDHINNVKDDNRLSNLRLATTQQNTRNSLLNSNNKSGYKGVSWHKHTSKWVATIGINGKRLHLGLFDTPELAYEEYCKRAKIEFGAFFNGGNSNHSQSNILQADSHDS